MRIDKGGLGMLRKYAVLLGDDLLKRCWVGSRSTAIWMKLEFQPAFIGGIHRLPKLGRIRSMNQYRNPKFPRFGPNWIQIRMVHGNTLSAIVLGV